ncbi:MAG: PEP-CTERM sorting domain-containing protein [Nitrospira sp.]
MKNSRWLQHVMFICLTVLGFTIGLTQAAWALSSEFPNSLRGQVVSLATDTAGVINDSGVQTAVSGPLTLSNSAVQGGSSAFSTETVNYGVIMASAGSSYSGNSTGAESGNTSGQWFDTFSIVSSTLTAGTPVTLSGMLTLDIVETAVGQLGFNNAGSGTLAELQVNNGISNPIFNISQNILTSTLNGTFNLFTPVTINTFVGGTLFVNGILNLNALCQNGPCSTTLDASHTSIFTLASATAGADYTTASGTSYLPQASAVPEPATLLLLGSGLIGLAAWRWKRAA